MGREIVRVPENWEHPTFIKYDDNGFKKVTLKKPIYNDSFDDVFKSWLDDLNKVIAGKSEYYSSVVEYIQDDPSPIPENYTSYYFKDSPLVWWQLWENVSEGTPVTPPFATAEELAKYLSEKGDYWYQARPNGILPTYEQALNFVERQGCALTGIIENGEFKTGASLIR